VPKEFALLPPIVLDRISTDWVLGPGNNLLTHYTLVGTLGDRYWVDVECGETPGSGLRTQPLARLRVIRYTLPRRKGDPPSPRRF
jgi:hypothetical protein